MTALTPSPLLDVSHVPRGGTPGDPLAGPVDALPALRRGDRVGGLVVTRLTSQEVELRCPADVGFARALVGLVPILWAAAAWAKCAHDHLIAERLTQCFTLTALALASALVLLNSAAKRWHFDGRRRRVRLRTGPLPLPVLWRRVRAQHVTVDVVPATTFSGVGLRIALGQPGSPQIEIARWPRHEIDRTQVEAVARAIRTAMKWD
ncbi:MAG: hypothetical protein ACAI43_26375 [Phycisphaerae bacterium]